MNRKAFEEYMESNPHFVGFFEPRCERDPDGAYRYLAIQEHWLTWQRATQVRLLDEIRANLKGAL
jgi:hypothetical protein